jgi:hypothetical protein
MHGEGGVSRPGYDWKSPLLIFGVIVVASLIFAKACHAQRNYWPVNLDSAAIGHFRKHTHVAVTGKVGRVAKEADGDLHIALVSPSGAFIIAECTPKEPCQAPKLGTTITVRGISRQDSEHGWWEVHPVESWSLETPNPLNRST